MKAVLGPPGTIVMAVAILISTFGCVNGLILAGRAGLLCDGARRPVLSQRGEDHEPADPRRGAGRAGLLGVAAHAAAHVVTDPATGAVSYGNVYTQLLEYIVAADLIFYVLMVGAVMVLRRKFPQAPRPYSNLGYPVVPLIYVAIAGLLIVDLAYLAPSTSGIGYLFVLTGRADLLNVAKPGPSERKRLSDLTVNWTR